MFDKYQDILEYAKKIGLENTPQYKKIEYAIYNYSGLTKQEQERLINILNELQIRIVDNDETGFRNNFGF